MTFNRDALLDGLGLSFILFDIVVDLRLTVTMLDSECEETLLKTSADVTSETDRLVCNTIGDVCILYDIVCIMERVCVSL